jgi:hypothetical protein
VGPDKAFDTTGFVDVMRDLNVTPHVAQNTTGRRSAIDGRTTRHPGYAISQRARKRVEEIFVSLKTVGLMRKLRHRGTGSTGCLSSPVLCTIWHGSATWRLPYEGDVSLGDIENAK